ncbi:MAG: molybdenum ABC transporter ATP-binding protein [Candidatus Competibacteraceae bacterium]|nr:molybdenum ABC transporter ATP-binding protein [Candidatus Competibacteraceae bacterium]
MLALDLELRQGSFTLEGQLTLEQPVSGLFGPSGCGKSTLLRAIAGLIRPRAGYIRLDGAPLFDARRGIDVPPHRRRVGLVFQDSQLFPHLSVEANLLYGFTLLPLTERRFAPARIVELLDIGHLSRRRPRHLSGGERQRVALGRALLSSPRLLLLDEPLAALDEGRKQQILPFLRRVRDELNLPMLYVSHAINEILYLTPHLAVMDRGRILGQGLFSEVIRQDSILGLARSLGLENVLRVTVERHEPEIGSTTVRYDGHELHLPLSALPPGAATWIALRAADVALARQPVAGITIQNQVLGRLLGLRRIGDRVLAEVDIGVPILAEVTVKAVRDLDLREGETVYCLFKARAWQYLGAA